MSNPATTAPATPTVRAAHVFYCETQLAAHAVLKTQLGPKDAVVQRRDGSSDHVHRLSFLTAERIIVSGKNPNNMTSAEVQDVAREIVDQGLVPAEAVTSLAAPQITTSVPTPAAPAAPGTAATEAPKTRKPRAKAAQAEAVPTTAVATTAPAAQAAPTPAPTAAVFDLASRLCAMNVTVPADATKLVTPLLPVVVMLEAACHFLEQQPTTDQPRFERLRGLTAEYKESIFA